MKLFYTNSSAKAEITELEARISTLEAASLTDSASITRLTGDLSAANDAIALMTAERDEAAAAVTEAEKLSSKSTADLTAANSKLATFDADVEKSAQARFAGLGGPPIVETSTDPTSVAGSKTMKEFNSISPACRMAFVKSGGKLTD